MSDASLNIDIKGAGSIAAAQQNLDKLSSSSRTAGSSTRELYSHMDALTRSMEKMMQVQARTNQLVLDGVRAQQETARSTEASISSMTKLTVGINLASAAWDYFRGSSARAGADAGAVTQQMNALASSLDNVLNRFRQIQASNFDLSKALVGLTWAAPNAAFGAPGPAPMTTGQGMFSVIQQSAMRAGLSGAALGQGANIGSTLGIGTGGGVNLTSEMQRNLNGMSVEALQAQRTMHEFGVATTDTVKGLREFLKALGETRDDPRRLANLHAVLPGADPSILTRTNLAMLNPVPGSEGALLRARSDESARLRADIATMQDTTRANQLSATRQFFGLLPANGQRSIGESFGSENYNLRSVRIRESSADVVARSERGDLGFVQALTEYAKSRVAWLQNNVSAATFGLVPPPTLPSPADGRATGPRSQEDRDLLFGYEQRIGRFSPGAMQQRIADVRMQGANLVSKGMLTAEENDQGIARLEVRLQRLVDPVGHMMELVGQQANLAGMTGAQRQRAALIQQGGNLAFESGKEGLSTAQIAQIDNTLKNERTDRGTRLMADTQEATKHEEDLTRAVGGTREQTMKLNAEYETEQLIKKGAVDVLQRTAVAQTLYNQSLAEFEKHMATVLEQQKIHNEGTAREATAALTGPAAVRRAGISSRIDEALGIDSPANHAAREQMRRNLEGDISNSFARTGNEQIREQANRNADFASSSPYTFGFASSARRRLEARGIDNPSAGQMRTETSLIAGNAGQDQVTSARIRNDLERQAIELEKQMPAAIAAGVLAEKDLEATMRVEAQYAKEIAEQKNAGNTEGVAALEAEKAKTLEMEKQKNALSAQNAFAKEKRDFDRSMRDTNQEIGALGAGGISEMERVARANGIANRLMDAGVPEGQARAAAEEQAKMTQDAEDYKKAIIEATNNLKGDAKSAISAVADGLADAVGNGKKLTDSLKGIGDAVSKIGFKAFVTRPLEKMFDNAIEGKGFTTGAGGHSGSDVMDAAFGGLFGSSKKSGSSTQANADNSTSRSTGGGGGGIAGSPIEPVTREILGAGGRSSGSRVQADADNTVSTPSAPAARGRIQGPYGDQPMDYTQGGGPITNYDTSGNGAAPGYGSVGTGGYSYNAPISAGDPSSYPVGGSIYDESNTIDFSGGAYHRGGWARHHDGGDIDGMDLAPDEVPAVLQTGEYVLNRDEAADYAAVRGEFGGDPSTMWDSVKGTVSGIGADAMKGMDSASGMYLNSYNDALSGDMSGQAFGRIRALGVLGAGAPLGALVGGETALFNQVGSGYARAMEAGRLMTYGQYGMGGGSSQTGAGYDNSTGSFVDAAGKHWYHGGGRVRKFHEGGDAESGGSSWGDAGTLLLGAGLGGAAGFAIAPAFYGKWWTDQQKRNLRQQMATMGAGGGGLLSMLMKGGGGGLSKLFGGGGKGSGNKSSYSNMKYDTPSPNGYDYRQNAGSSAPGGGGSSEFGSSGGDYSDNGAYGGGSDDGFSGGGGDFGDGGGDYGGGGDFGGGGDWGGSGAFGDLGGDLGGVFHAGGSVVPWRRFHGGGLADDEVPILAQAGERVLSRSENRDFEQGGGGRGDVYVTQHIHTPDAASFRATSRQVSAATRNAMDMAANRNV